MPRCYLLHKLNLLLRQAVEFIDELVDLVVGGFDLTLNAGPAQVKIRPRSPRSPMLGFFSEEISIMSPDSELVKRLCIALALTSSDHATSESHCRPY